MIDLPSLARKICAAWQRERGSQARVDALHRLSAGASAQTFALELVEGERRHACVVQVADGGEPFAGALSKPEQARMQQAAFLAGITTPEVLLTLDDDADSAAGFVTRRTAGETLGQRIVHAAQFAAARSRLPRQCAALLARIHALPKDQLPFLPLLSAQSQCSELAHKHRHYGEARPIFEASLAWLRDHQPEACSPCAVHGDFRMGNLLVDGDGLAGVLDWELAHFGDPLEDLGWLCVRSWRFGRADLPVGGFATRETFYAAYAEASGVPVEPRRVHFWEMLGTLKWGVICQWFAQRRLSGSVRGVEPALIGRRVSEVELQLLDLLESRGV